MVVKTTILGASYKGQPVYREWSRDRSELIFFSREVKKLAAGGWKFVRLIPLKTVKISTKLTDAQRTIQALAAQKEVLKSFCLQL